MGQDTPPTKSEIIALLDGLWGQLSQSEQADRAECRQAALRYIQHAPKNGLDAPLQKSFRNRKMKRGVRIDLEILLGKACVDDP